MNHEVQVEYTNCMKNIQKKQITKTKSDRLTHES